MTNSTNDLLRTLVSSTNLSFDTIFIENLILESHIGVSDEERSHPQRLRIDITVETIFSSATQTDKIEDTLNYSTLKKCIEKSVSESSFNLLESLAGHLAEQLLLLNKVKHLAIRIQKLDIWSNAQPGVYIYRSKN